MRNIISGFALPATVGSAGDRTAAPVRSVERLFFHGATRSERPAMPSSQVEGLPLCCVEAVEDNC
jgi:hypothetical protein